MDRLRPQIGRVRAPISPNAALELKSKAAYVDDLIGLDHGGRTTCAWSVNAREIVAAEEHRAATLDQRFAAAARCEKAGYRVAFHFDPIFHYEGWEQGYQKVIKRIFASVPAESIAWISLGCFRFVSGLDRSCESAFPPAASHLANSLWGGDGKMR